jgi:RHS repeat-associated protein
VYAGDRHSPELMVRPDGTQYRIVSDHLGSPRLIVNTTNSADVLLDVRYSAFGAVSGSGVGVVPMGFAGGLYDYETALVTFGARDYNSETGRWARKDPMRFRADDGTNLYAYARLDPVNRVDPNGRNSVPWWLPAGAGAAAADGPFPIGDVIGICIIAAGVTYDLLTDEDESPVDCTERAGHCATTVCGHLLGQNYQPRKGKRRGGGTNTQFGFDDCYRDCMEAAGC